MNVLCIILNLIISVILSLYCFIHFIVIDVIILTWVGGNPPEGNFILIGRVATIYYFSHFLFIMPIIGIIEKPRSLPNSISEPVLNNPLEKEG